MEMGFVEHTWKSILSVGHFLIGTSLVNKMSGCMGGSFIDLFHLEHVQIVKTSKSP